MPIRALKIAFLIGFLVQNTDFEAENPYPLFTLFLGRTDRVDVHPGGDLSALEFS